MSNENLTPPAAPFETVVPPRQRRGRGVATTFLVCGLVVAGAGTASAAVSASRISGDTKFGASADVSGVTNIDIDTSASDLRLEFGDVSEATLTVNSDRQDGVSRWELERDGDELSVSQNGGWFGWGFQFGPDGDELAVLTLPQELEGKVNLSIDVSAGNATVDGDFMTTVLDVGAGFIEFSGSASDLSTNVSAGHVLLDANDVETLAVEVSAGEVEGAVTGTAPLSSEFVVSAGSITLTMPDEAYRVDTQNDWGDANVDVETSSRATNTISIELNAGDITLRPQR